MKGGEDVKGRYSRVISAWYILMQYQITRAWVEMLNNPADVELWGGWCQRVEDAISSLPARDSEILQYVVSDARPVDIADAWDCSVLQARACASIALALFYREFMANGKGVQKC